ncbi:STAS domain-containing protein [Peribacillus sp. SCS-155]|uniref:STAS domain-containing protein n=1 Tax=Peribacillus sedimenti TaxID=3115297 RepID=UPI00390596F4
MGEFRNKVAEYLNVHQKEIIHTLLPQTLKDLNITFTKQDLDIHFRMLDSLLGRIAASLLISKAETTKNEPGYDPLNYFFDRGVQLKETVAVLCSFRLSLLKYLRQSKVIMADELDDGLQIYETIIFAYDEVIRMTTYRFNEQMNYTQLNMERELDGVTAPVVWINDTHAVMPLVGTFSSSRMNKIMENTLAQVSQQNVQKLIIDFSGVINFDIVLGKSLFDLICSLELVGTEVVITGFTPAMAKTSVDLDVDFSSLKIFGQLKQALSR